jgi:hypothetical protein
MSADDTLAILLGRRIHTVQAVVVRDPSGRRIALDESVVLVMEDGPHVQIIVEQAVTIIQMIEQLSDARLPRGYEAELGIETQPMELPFWPTAGLVVNRLTEYWADDSAREFLMGFVAADRANHELPVLTGGTEVEIVEPEAFAVVIEQSLLPIRAVTHEHNRPRRSTDSP